MQKAHRWSEVKDLDDLRGPHWTKERDDSVRAARSARLPAAKTPNQASYMEAMRSAVVTLCNGPAGSGKTFLACAFAAERLIAGKASKIILTRPLVTCGKGIGFLPGEKDEKVAPHMRPLLEALKGFFPAAEFEGLLKSNVIEMWPMDLMRGMSIKDAVLLCDEAQNAEFSQLKMVLSRMEGETRVVVTGDATQSDVPSSDGKNPLTEVIRRLGGLDGVAIVRLVRGDIVRHGLIGAIDERLSDEWGEADHYLPCPKCLAGLWFGDDDMVVCWSCDALVEVDLRRACPSQDDRSKSLAAVSFPERRGAQ